MDTGTRKSTITGLVVVGLLASGSEKAQVLAVVVAGLYLVLNTVLHLRDKSGVDEGGEEQ